MSDTPKTIEALEDLTPDDVNANRHTERGEALLEKSLSKYGAGRSILVDKNGKVIAGNSTLQKAVEAGLGITVVQEDGTRLVVVQRVDLDMDSDPRARELAIADNRVAEVSLDWNPENLIQLKDAGVNLGEFFLEDELSKVLAQKEPPSEFRGTDDVKTEHACPQCGFQIPCDRKK
jgi:hypothetical protein